MSLLVSVPGVLRTDTGTPVQGMIEMVRGIIPATRTVICSPEERDELFLAREGVRDYAAFLELDTLDALAAQRVSGHIDVVWTADTDVARVVAKQGVSVMLCAVSAVVDPRWRPERKGWGDLLAVENMEV